MLDFHFSTICRDRRAALESGPRFEVVRRLSPGGPKAHDTVVDRKRVLQRLNQFERRQNVFSLEQAVQDDLISIFNLNKSQEYTRHELYHVS